MPARRSRIARPRPWQRRSDARPGELRIAALRLFAEKGYGDAPVEDIAAAAGVTVGTLYRYFDDKDALFQSLVDWVVTVPLLPEEPPPATGETAADLEALLGLVWAGSRREPHREMLRVLLAASGSEPAAVARYRSEVVEPVERAVAAALEGLPDPATAARSALGAVLGASVLAGAPGPALVPQLAPAATIAAIVAGIVGREKAPVEEGPRPTRPSPRYAGPESW